MHPTSFVISIVQTALCIHTSLFFDITCCTSIVILDSINTRQPEVMMTSEVILVQDRIQTSLMRITEHIQTGDLTSIPLPEFVTLLSHKPLTVGLVGFSDLRDGQRQQACQFIEHVLVNLTLVNPTKRFNLIARLTDYGVPAIGYIAARAINKYFSKKTMDPNRYCTD